MRRCLFSFLLVSSLSSLLTAQVMISRSAADSFLTAFEEALRERHPFFQVDSSRQMLKDSLLLSQRELANQPGDSVALYEAFRLADRLRAGSGDGHLTLLPKRPKKPTASQRRRVTGMPLHPLADGRVVLSRAVSWAGDTLPPGTEILTYNGHGVRKLIDQFSYLTGLNDNNHNGAPRRMAARLLPARYVRYYGATDSIIVTALRDGQPYTWTAPLILPPAPAPTPTQNKAPPKPQRKAYSPFSSHLSGDSSYWLMTVRSFNEQNYKGKSLKRRLRAAFKDLAASGKEKLIIDIRGNGGGQLSRGAALLSYFIDREWQALEVAESLTPAAKPPNVFLRPVYWWIGVRKMENGLHQPRLVRLREPAPERFRFDGAVVILIDEYTFSTSSLFATWAKRHRAATLVGTTAGGSPNVVFGGFFRETDFEIAGETYVLRMPTYRFAGDFLPEKNLEPDVYVPLTVEGFRAGEDPQLEAAIEILKEE